MKTLIVAPEGNHRKTLFNALKLVRRLIPVRTASTWVEAQELMETHSLPDLIIFDLQVFPDGDEGCVQQVREHLPDTPCIALVETTRQIHLVEAARIDGWLFKGFRMSELIDKIDTLASQNMRRKI